MAKDQRFLWTEKPPTDDNTISDFLHDFKTYVEEKELLCQRRHDGSGCVFWSREDDRCERPAPVPFSETPPIAANPELTQKIKSVIEGMVLERKEKVLVQFWKSIVIGSRLLLTTQDQPFGIDTSNEGLCSYRLLSLNYQFYVDGESDEDYLGLPGRVFRHQQIESTPNVQHYTCKEYPQRDGALLVNIRKCSAFPVLEPSGQRCVGVLELVLTAEMKRSIAHLQYLICTEVEAVGLRSSELSNPSHFKPTKEKHKDKKAFKDALVEIMEVLQQVCTTHHLPLAQTWVLCRHCNDSSGVSCREHLMFRYDIACHRETDNVPFTDACSIHTLGKGQGVVGRAFSSHNLVFCNDISQFSINEYPLAHYAREYGLTGCFAICLWSSNTGDNVYVLEFFLPPRKTEGGDPRITLVPLLATMKQHFQSFTVASGKELGEELPIEVIDFPRVDKLNSFQISKTARSPDRMENGGDMEWLDLSDQQVIEVDAIDTGNNFVSNIEENNIAGTSSNQKSIINSSLRQHRKAGIPISYDDIQQHFGMKLDAAAESLGVSRSTFKRACREYEILWWSSRKRSKDKNYLSNKFVQGAAQEQIRESSQPPISNPPHKHDLVTAARTEPLITAAQDTSIVTIKAKYGDVFIKFQLPVSSGMVDFHQQVAKRLKLNAGTYNVKYKDEDNDWILIACDEDLQNYICNSRSLERNTVTLSLQQITNCPPWVLVEYLHLPL